MPANYSPEKKRFHCIIAGGDSLRFICECLYLKPPTADTIAELQIIRVCAEANQGDGRLNPFVCPFNTVPMYFSD